MSSETEKQSRAKPFASRMKAIALDRSLTSTAKAVAMLLYYEFVDGKSGQTEVGLKKIAASLGCNERTARNAYVGLEKNGHIAVAHHKGEYGTNVTKMLPATDADVRRAADRSPPKTGKILPVNEAWNRKIFAGSQVKIDGRAPEENFR